MAAQKNTYRGYELFDKNLLDLPQSYRTVVNTINQYSFCVAEEDDEFKAALEKSDVLLPDGVGIVLAIKATTGLDVKKISGTDLHLQQLKRLNEIGGKCFYLGSSDKTLEKIKNRLTLEYPNITCAYYSPSYCAEFSDKENEEMISQINKFQPDVLFVGMTAPKQEKWTYLHKDNIDANLICSIGAVFDFFAGTVKRPSAFWINLKLEWFIRLLKEPKRMWKRYLYYGPIFLAILVKEMLVADIEPSPAINVFEKQKGISN
jgi:N-acetylglucosaminyldiphosphoundecaprenol N-acetyl-beta-D-mannosaminyltransferase